MNLLSLAASVALIHLLAISSPGPTFLVVSRYATAGDRRAALLVAVGVVLATLTWSAFAATGLGAVALAHPRLFAAVQYAGAAYLIWLGAKLLYALARPAGGADAPKPPVEEKGGWRAVGAGYLTNISNPKVIAYYTSLFGVMLPPNPTRQEFLVVVATVCLVSALWWSAIGWFFTLEPVRRGFARIRRGLEGAMGVLLIGFGLKLIAMR